MMQKLRKVAASLVLAIASTGVAAVVAAPAAQAATYTNCYTQIDGRRIWCYKTCSAIEEFHGCNSGWYWWPAWSYA